MFVSEGVGRRLPKRGWSLGDIGDFAYPGGGSLRTKETGAALIFKAVGSVIISSWAWTSCVRRNRALEIGDNTGLFVTGRTAAGEIRMWARVTFLTEDLKLLLYERIVKYYLRYVLLRCCEYTNSRREAEQIAAYTLITTCSLLEQLRQGCDLAWLMDRMLEVIGREQGGAGRLGAWEQTCGSGPLLSDEKLQKLAGCANRLEGFSGQVLVLGLVEKMGPEMISEIYGKSVEEIVLVIDGAERELAEHLREDSGTGSAESVEDLSGLMCELGDALELDSRERIARTVLCYLAQDAKDDCGLSGRLAPEDLN
ncbi:MAG: hypothetical protein ACYSUP_03040 [Planctomycetota bacterium]